jgi:hypothetical protein
VSRFCKQMEAFKVTRARTWRFKSLGCYTVSNGKHQLSAFRLQSMKALPSYYGNVGNYLQVYKSYLEEHCCDKLACCPFQFLLRTSRVRERVSAMTRVAPIIGGSWRTLPGSFPRGSVTVLFIDPMHSFCHWNAAYSRARCCHVHITVIYSRVRLYSFFAESEHN